MFGSNRENEVRASRMYWHKGDENHSANRSPPKFHSCQIINMRRCLLVADALSRTSRLVDRKGFAHLYPVLNS
jgi:hypothetical protein